MKKFFVCMVSIIIAAYSLTGCNSTGNETETLNTEAVETVKPTYNKPTTNQSNSNQSSSNKSTSNTEKKEITLSEAISEAISYAQNHQDKAKPIGCYSIKHFEIASSNVVKETSWYWIIELKGKLYGYDSYGSLVDIFKFQYQVEVSKSGYASYYSCKTFKK